MSDIIIEIENISKLYKLGTSGTGTLTHDLNRWWHKLRSKEDPYLLSATENSRSGKSYTGYVWTLKDINFQVREGEIFGIIGSNGAGKSTLLKLISKVTTPTNGFIRLNGKVASLLEVGTGFHPELTGRENIYLNGAILGMRKKEIKARLDEIIDFSGIEKYIDTPVKKYSSGMYVRLGFAVAAHLEPDILIVDEVLAVGDAEFQRKCLGKMKDVSSNKGRTILFVSHQMSAVKQLCTKAILLERGMQKAIGNIDDVIGLYQHEEADAEEGKRGKIPKGSPGYFFDWKLENTKAPNPHSCYTGDECIFSFGFYAQQDLRNCEVRFAVKYENLLILYASSLANKGVNFSISPGYYNFRFTVDFPVRDAKFDVEVFFFSFSKPVDEWFSSTKLTVLSNFNTHLYAGLINPPTQFSLSKELSPAEEAEVL